MTEKQIEWTKAQQKKLSDYITSHWPPTEQTWSDADKFVSDTVNAVAKKDKSAGEYVRERLLDVLEHYDREDRTERKNEKARGTSK